MKNTDNTHTLITAFQNNTDNVEFNNIKAVVKLINPEVYPEVGVHSMPSAKIYASKLFNIQCKVNLDNTTSEVSMLFGTEETELPEWLETINTTHYRPKPPIERTNFKQLKA